MNKSLIKLIFLGLIIGFLSSCGTNKMLVRQDKPSGELDDKEFHFSLEEKTNIMMKSNNQFPLLTEKEKVILEIGGPISQKLVRLRKEKKYSLMFDEFVEPEDECVIDTYYLSNRKKIKIYPNTIRITFSQSISDEDINHICNKYNLTYYRKGVPNIAEKTFYIRFLILGDVSVFKIIRLIKSTNNPFIKGIDFQLIGAEKIIGLIMGTVLIFTSLLPPVIF